MLMGFRFLAGCAGSAPLTLGGGTISDLIPREKRGAGVAVFALGPLLGPVIGPVGGGFLVQAMGWRWVFWLLAIVGGAVQIMAMVIMQETYPVVLLERKANRLRKESSNNALHSEFDRGISHKELFCLSIIRPMKMLLDPCVLFLAIFLSITYGYLYLLFTTFPTVFTERYGFATGTVGLSYIGIGLGFMIGVGICGIFSDRIVRLKSAMGENKPEYRLTPRIMLSGALCTPVGLFVYGWSAEKEIFWIVPIFGTMITGAGILMCFMPIQAYMVDCFTTYGASALATGVILRSVVGAVLPLAGQNMYDALGLGWGNSLLAFIVLVMSPIPLIFYIFGEAFRMSSEKRRLKWWFENCDRLAYHWAERSCSL